LQWNLIQLPALLVAAETVWTTEVWHIAVGVERLKDGEPNLALVKVPILEVAVCVETEIDIVGVGYLLCRLARLPHNLAGRGEEPNTTLLRLNSCANTTFTLKNVATNS
jgi:hypothetical protein